MLQDFGQRNVEAPNDVVRGDRVPIIGHEADGAVGVADLMRDVEV